MTISNTVPAATIKDAPDYRPVLHYTAADTWLNDPNGLVYYDGTYHLFYQNNPHGNIWGNMSWGHATSSDLATWIEHPVAITCDDDEDVYSGSIVIDHHNTSGFGSPESPAWIAIYTSAYKEPSPHRGTQAQSLAYSLDHGMTWTKFTGNPVLTRKSTDFRDPKVIWYDGPDRAHWVMAAVEARQNIVVFYGSDNLREWTLLSEFGPSNAHGDCDWECPDLFPAPLDNSAEIKWVLTVNVNPGAVAGGSGGQYFVGEFDGVRFTPESSGTSTGTPDLHDYQWLDWGRDYYAAVSFSNVPDNRRIMIAWMSNWDYANQTPTSPWRSAMTLAREITLATVDGRPHLIQRPILPTLPPQARLYGVSHLEITDTRTALPQVPSDAALIIKAEFLAGTATRFGLAIANATGSGEGLDAALVEDRGTVIAYDVPQGQLVLDRRRSGDTGFHRLFPSEESAPVRLRGGLLFLDIVVDRSSIEIFAQNGETSITDLIFASQQNRTLAVFAEGGVVTLQKLTVTAAS